MNKIYKVIWSKVKHQYVVVSELAHSCTKSTSSRVGRSAAAVLAALVLTTGVCAVPVQAADPTLEELYYEQINRAIQNGETSSPLVTLAEVPATTSAATEDGEPAAEEETQPGEDGSVTGTASQYTVTNKDGFYANNTKGTHNTLSKDGLWVGGKDDNTGFHVDNDGNVRTTGSVTVKSEQGDVIIQNGGVQAGNVKINTDGKNTITGLTNTTWDGTTETPDRAATEGQLGQVQGDLNELNKAAVKYDSDGQGGYTNNVTIGGQVTANSFQNTDGSFSVDANGNVDAETVKSEGMSVVDEDGNTTFQVLANGDVTAHDVTATTVTGGTVIGETIRNTNNSFSVDANGNVDAETVKSEGMSVVDEDGNTTFQVLSNGDVTAHAVTATTVTGGTIQNADGSFSVDANGNVDAETVKSEGMSVVDEDGNTTFQVLANGDVTAHDVIANSYSNVNGTFVADENGKVTAEKGDIGDVWLSEGNISNVKNIKAESGNIGDVKLADGKVTAEKGDIGDVWLSEGNISNVKNIKAESGNIGDVKLADGKITAEKGDIGDVWLSEGNISNVKKITAESGNIGDVKLADGKVTAQKADIGGVFIKNESIQAGNIKINENGSNEITGLSNTRWNDGTPVDEDRAATEGQLSTVQGYVDDLEAKTQHITHKENADGTHYTTVEEANFYSDGRMDAANGKFRVNEKGGVNVNDGAFQIYSSGGVQAAHGKFRVKGKTGEVTVDESLSVGKHDDGTYAFTVDKAGNAEVDGTMVIQGQTIINADADIKGSLEAAGNKFKVDGVTGEVTAPKGNIGGVILETTAEDGKSKVSADKADIGGVWIKEGSITTEEGTITAGDVVINSAGSEKINVGNGNFIVYEDGAVRAADDNFIVYKDGSVEAQGTVQAADATFAKDSRELVTAGQLYKAGIVPGEASGVNSMAIGTGAQALSTQAVAVGYNAAASGSYSVALGMQSGAHGTDSVALGRLASATADDSVALGANSVADRPNTVSVGREGNERQITNVADGIKATDAVNKGQLDTLAKGAVMYDVDEAGNITDNVTIGGKMEASEFANSNNTFMVTEDGAIWASGGGNIDGVGFQDGVVTAPEGISAGYDAFKVDAQGNVSTDGTIIAQGNSMIGGVTLEDGNVLTNEVWAGNNNFHVNETGSVTAPSVTGLENTEWNADEVVANRAATEGQLLDVQGNLDTLAEGAVMYDVDEAGNITDNVTIGGKMEASEFANSNNTFMVTEDGAIWASGGGNIDGVGFQDGVVTAPEGISAGYDAFKVDAQGNVSTDGTIIAQGNSMIGGVTLEDGNVLTNEVWAGNNNFHVNETGSVTAPSVTGLENTEWNADEVVADRAATEGQLAAVNTQVSNNSEILAEYEDAGITAGSVDGEAEGAIAIGEGAAAINGNSIPNGAIAIGREATVSMNGAVAIGDGANAVGQNSVALGTGASTTNGGWNSVAIGWGSQATDSYVVSVGSDEYKRRIVNVAAGENDNDAVNVGQLNSSLKSRVEYDYTTEADGTKTYKDTIGGVTLKEGEVTANTFKNSDSTFQVTEDGTIVAQGGGLIDGVGFEDGKVTATDFVLSTGTQSPVNMSDMWKVMTGGTFEYGTQTYGGAYFTKTGNTSYINYGGTSNINLNNLGQVMGAVENVGVDTVTSAINDLGQGKNASGASMNEKASTENTTETAVGPAANEILAAPAANEALAAPAMARPMAISTVTNRKLKK